MNTTKRTQLKLIDKAWAALEERLDSIKMASSMGTAYLNENKRETKSHRNFCSDGIKCGLTPLQEAKLFAVQQIVKYAYTSERKPELIEYLSTRKSIYTAASIALNYPEEITQALSCLKATDFGTILAMDYVELIKAD